MQNPSDRVVAEQIEIALAAAGRNDGIIPIVEAGDPILRTPARPYDGQVDDDVLLQLLLAMRTTMRAAPGVGLAAPQVGIGVRLAVIEDPATLDAEVAAARSRTLLPFTPLINPEYRAAGAGEAGAGAKAGAAGAGSAGADGEVGAGAGSAEDVGLVSFYEGRLSVPGYQAVRARHSSVVLRAQDNEGHSYERTVTGWAARIVQHETDHLDGVLYLDDAEPRSLTTNDQLTRWWNQPTPAAAAQALGF